MPVGVYLYDVFREFDILEIRSGAVCKEPPGGYGAYKYDKHHDKSDTSYDCILALLSLYRIYWGDCVFVRSIFGGN